VCVFRHMLRMLPAVDFHDQPRFLEWDGKFHKENATDEAPAPDPTNMPASGTEQLVTQRP